MGLFKGDYLINKLVSYDRKILAFWVCIVFFFLGVFLSIANPVFASPGSGTDPLVSLSWVDNYIDKSFDKLDADVKELSQKVAALQRKHITLYIGNTTALINDLQVTMDVPPTLINGYTMLPLRFVGEALGITVIWDNNNKTVTCADSNKKIILPLGGKEATVNGKLIALPAPPASYNGRILVPARFIAEAFSCRVDWLGGEKRVDIY